MQTSSENIGPNGFQTQNQESKPDENAKLASSTTSPPNKVCITGFYKVEKVGPIFRIVDPNVKRKDAKLAAAVRANEDIPDTENEKRKNGELFADDRGPYWHHVKNPMITRPIITENLPHQFEGLPVLGAPECPGKLEDYQNNLIRQFVGCDLDDAEYEELESYCNPDMLKTGKELRMVTRAPVPGDISKNSIKDFSLNYNEEYIDEEPVKELCVLEKLRTRMQSDTLNSNARSLKYRGTKMLPLIEQESATPEKKLEPPDLEPGKDVLFRIRTYRPFTFLLTGEKHVRGRHSVFNCDIVMLGRQSLTSLRDRFTCRNDTDLRLDLSDNPETASNTSAKVVFPSGFLFINNTFYVDGRTVCRDTSAGIRRWASARGLGDFPLRRMEDHTLGEVLVKLAHPEVYVHQGNCEHVFLFSEIRLLNRSDPLHLSAYPCHTAISQNQTIYCTTCAEFGAKWLVTGSCKVPFDPAFFCDVCFHKYLYKDKKKIDDFKAYAYRGNELNLKSTKTIWSLK